MELKQKILELACKKNACTTGIDKLLEMNTTAELIDCYFKYIDFCLAKKVPSLEFIKANFDNEVLTSNGICLNMTGSANYTRRYAVIGESNMTLIYFGYDVGRVYVADNSKVTINAIENAFVVVDAVDNATVVVNASENAKVMVNAYSDTDVSGNAKIIRKKTFTYEL